MLRQVFASIARALSILLIVLLLVAPPAWAAACEDEEGAERCHSGFSAYLENDSLLFNKYKDDDRNYTMGLAFHWSGRWIRDRGLATPLYWIDSLPPIRRITPDFAESGASHHTLKFGNVAFTPNMLNTRRPIRNDRPYASLLFLDTAAQAIDQSEQNAFTTEFSMAMLGLSISERFQRWLHKKQQDAPNEAPFPPEGWDNQISNGGEPTARYTVRWQHSPHVGRHFDFQWIGETSLGYHTNLGAGAAVRVGEIHSPWWQFTATPIQQGKPLVGVARRSGCRALGNQRYEFYGWAGSMGRMWGYNVLLQGQFRDSVVTVDTDNIERFVYDYSAGVNAGICLGNNWHRLNISYSRRSPEFDGPQRRYHSWGGLYYSIAVQP
jgi:hypothetical protein